MFKSREVRWFFKDDNEHIASWFRSQRLNFNQVDVRTDYYHLPTLGKALGIKLREGRLEIKHRTSGPYTGELFKGQIVEFEEWIKWGFELKEDDPESLAILQGRQHPDWLSVEKQRMAVTLGLDQKGEMQIYGRDHLRDRGCQAEYTELKVSTEKWYTFGLEWFGEPWIDLNQKFLKEILGTTDLSEQTTSSYPSFLLHQTPMKG